MKRTKKISEYQRRGRRSSRATILPKIVVCSKLSKEFFSRCSSLSLALAHRCYSAFLFTLPLKFNSFKKMLMLLLLHHRSCKYLSVQAVQKRFPSPELKKMIPLSLVKKTGVQTLLWKRCQDFRKQTRKSREIILVKKKFVKLKWDLHYLARM